MGWAKYYEDNAEIVYERQETMQSRIQKSEIKIAYVTVPPAIEVAVEIQRETLDHKQKDFKDKYIICKDCGRKFLFTASVQRHYNKMGWIDPKRCKCCRSCRNARYLMRLSY